MRFVESSQLLHRCFDTWRSVASIHWKPQAPAHGERSGEEARRRDQGLTGTPTAARAKTCPASPQSSQRPSVTRKREGDNLADRMVSAEARVRQDAVQAQRHWPRSQHFNHRGHDKTVGAILGGLYWTLV
jgi:hypothetical protein